MFWNNTKKERQKSTQKKQTSLPREAGKFRGEPMIVDTSSPNTTEEVFSVQLLDPISEGSQNTWAYNIPVLSNNQKKLMLQMVGGEFFILNVPTANFPRQLYVCCNQVSGFVDNQGIQTHKVAILRLRQIIPITTGAVVSYTLIYSVLDQALWDLGLQRTLSFYVADSTGVWDPPYASDMYLEFKIIHVGY